MKRRRRTSKLPIVLLSAAIIVITAIALLNSGIFAPELNATYTPTVPAVTNTAPPTATGTIDLTPTPSPTATPTPKPAPDEVTIKMVGDILLHQSTRGSAKLPDGTHDFNPYFELIKPNMQGDLVIANIESPIDAHGNGSGYSSYPRFNIPREIIPALKNIGVNLALTSNNHALDKGYTGLVNTKKALRELGLDHYGTFESQEEYDTYKILTVNNIKIGVLAYTDSTNGLLSSVEAPYRNYCIRAISLNSDADLEKMVREVKGIREAGAEFVIVSLHWGREYADEPNTRQRAIAQSLIEAGADVIMGNHSHCVQPITKKNIVVDGKEKPVVVAYSLGNFMADQMPLELRENLTQHSMILNITARRDVNTGDVTIADASYTPTFIHRDTIDASKTLYKYKVLPAGKYALAESRPSIFETDEKWRLCKQAWERTQRIVGNAIPALPGV